MFSQQVKLSVDADWKNADGLINFVFQSSSRGSCRKCDFLQVELSSGCSLHRTMDGAWPYSSVLPSICQERRRFIANIYTWLYTFTVTLIASGKMHCTRCWWFVVTTLTLWFRTNVSEDRFATHIKHKTDLRSAEVSKWSYSDTYTSTVVMR